VHVQPVPAKFGMTLVEGQLGQPEDGPQCSSAETSLQPVLRPWES
jgi:hypothetical protein